MPTAELTAGNNTYGTTLDVMVRPELDADPRCHELLRRVAEGIMVTFPQTTEQAIQDSIVQSLLQVDSSLARMIAGRLSADLGNRLQSGSDGGLFVGSNVAASSSAVTSANAGGSAALPL